VVVLRVLGVFIGALIMTHKSLSCITVLGWLLLACAGFARADSNNPPAAPAAKIHVSSRHLAVDMATLKAAKSSALSMDRASSLLRQQKLATLEQEQKRRRWFEF
jgi:hypothetical protein